MKKTIKTAADLLKNPSVMEAVSADNPASLRRRNFSPPLCPAFTTQFTILETEPGHSFIIDPEAKQSLPDIIGNVVQAVKGVDDLESSEKKVFQKPRNIGIVFSGGPAPGGHNVIAGLFDSAMKANPESRIFGFIQGPQGVIEGKYKELDRVTVDAYRNLGGFCMIKTGRTKIDSEKKMNLARKTCKDLNLDALVVVGGDDSNTNAAFLAQEMLKDGVQVIGVPKTIDGDIQVRDADGKTLCAMSFGFHSAARGFSTAIANLCTDADSDVKYWHICKVMGRVASHLALEVALQTHADMTLIGEDLADYVDEERIRKAQQKGEQDYTAYGMTLRHLSRVICDGIVKRAAAGKNYGILVIPEGILEFINEIQMFIIKLNTVIAEYNDTHDTDFHSDFPTLDEKQQYLGKMARMARENETFSIWNTRDDDLFNDIPPFFREGLLTERDSHGNFQFSQVETEKVLLGLVKDYLNILRENGEYRIGFDRSEFFETVRAGGLDPEKIGSLLFENFRSDENPLLTKPSIISLKTLEKKLVDSGVVKEGEGVPEIIRKIYEKTVPKFKTQTHFYGYDGRGSDPTWFDCTYTYNLGRTVFSLIAGGATGQMAAIKNLERAFEHWKPIGIPIAPLMHLEERKGKLSLVLEKSIVDLNSPAFQTVKALRDEWLAAHPGKNPYRKPAPIRFDEKADEDRPITLLLNAIGSELS